jgi:uncharacterized membrane protein YeaQ/YmgE (transglycosylase-associated protein family)
LLARTASGSVLRKPWQEGDISFLTWIVLGVVAGFIASKIVNYHSAGILLDIVPGSVGAVVGGCVLNIVGTGGASGFKLAPGAG